MKKINGVCHDDLYQRCADQFHISDHAIRYYEKEGLVTIPRDNNHILRFDDKAILQIKAITYYRNVDTSL
uniref:MerR family transcriptional regulator n=1 Tax=Streptococcus ferus TaxID=1345 RepID=UPI00359F8881